MRPDAELDQRILHGFNTLFARLDSRVADVIETGLQRNGYFARVKLPRIVDHGGPIVAPPRERYLPLAEAERTTIVELVRSRLRPTTEPAGPLPTAARSRAELHAAIVHQPEGRSAGPALST